MLRLSGRFARFAIWHRFAARPYVAPFGAAETLRAATDRLALVRSDLPGGAMLYDPAKRCADTEHHFNHIRPGYLECERCHLRLIQRAVLLDGVHPTNDDIEWLHHRQ
jgi:hypothetical protein